MSDLRAAVAAGVFGAEDGYRALLRATVEVARAIFHAKAASVFLLDEATEELVFEAVAGEGADTLGGQRFPADTGVAGWRSEEHTSELQSRFDLVCRLLLEKKKKKKSTA